MSRAQPNFVLMPNDDPVRTPGEELRRRALRLLQQADESPDRDRAARPAGFAAPAAIGPIEAPQARALAVGVVTMPAVFLAVVLGALAVFGKPASEPARNRADASQTLAQPGPRAATAPTFVAAPANAQGSIVIAEDSRVSAIALDGERIALNVESPAGAEILIYDTAQGRVVLTAPIVTASLFAQDRLAGLTGAPPVASLAVVVPTSPEFDPAEQDPVPFAPRVKPAAPN